MNVAIYTRVSTQQQAEHGYSIEEQENFKNEILQFIMFIMSIISTAFTIAFIIFKWYNKAKEERRKNHEYFN